MEIEIKLDITRENALLVFDALGADKPEHISMETTYFADKDRQIEQNKMMLRLRRENDVSVCTFKAPLPHFDGRARLEIEASAENIESGVAEILIDPRISGTAREILSHGGMTSACGAEFARLQAVCGCSGVQFKLSFDEGKLYAGGNSAPICEMELELLSGDFAVLVKISDRICSQFNARVLGKSKAQRAFELI